MDIGKVIVAGGFGWWCESADVENFRNKVKETTDVNVDGGCFDEIREAKAEKNECN